jgi:hypothetical protein
MMNVISLKIQTTHLLDFLEEVGILVQHQALFQTPKTHSVHVLHMLPIVLDIGVLLGAQVFVWPAISGCGFRIDFIVIGLVNWSLAIRTSLFGVVTVVTHPDCAAHRTHLRPGKKISPLEKEQQNYKAELSEALMEFR